MSNGLKFTVPSGWDATSTLYVGAGEVQGGAWDATGAAQYVTLRPVGTGWDRLLFVTVTSWRDARSQVPPSSVGVFLAVPAALPLEVLVQSRHDKRSPSLLYVLQTHNPAAQPGTVVIGVDPGQSPDMAVGGTVAVLRLEGVSLPPLWRFDD
jgi:hypothetical protein